MCLGLLRRVLQGRGWPGGASPGGFCHGVYWHGWLGGLRHGRFLYGLFRFGCQGWVGFGKVCNGTVWLEWRGRVCYVPVRIGVIRYGRRVMVSCGRVCYGGERNGRQGGVSSGLAGCCGVWFGLLWQAIKGGILWSTNGKMRHG